MRRMDLHHEKNELQDSFPGTYLFIDRLGGWNSCGHQTRGSLCHPTGAVDDWHLPEQLSFSFQRITGLDQSFIPGGGRDRCACQVCG